jgi:hypothetical protein
MSKSEKSPMQVYKYWLKVWATFVLITFFCGVAGFKLDYPYTEKVSTEVTLVQAYSTMQHCGKHNTCEEFIGRFRAADGKVYNREMDGFFYHSYVDGGRKDIPGAHITLSANDRGIETPTWIKVLMFNMLLSVFIFLCAGIPLLLGSIDVEYSQREWDRQKEHVERTEKWRRKMDDWRN